MPDLDVQWLGRMEYRAAWNLQRELAEQRRSDAAPDTLLLVEHPPVFTLGRNTEPAHLGAGEAVLRELGADVVEVDRGGSVTFHGWGQLVAYPIVRLASLVPMRSNPAQADVVEYVRRLEAVLIATVAAFGVTAERRRGYTGAWVGNAKLAAIGVKLASGGVTTHGIGLNVSTDLSWFDAVVPCGIADADVTSLEHLGVTVGLLEVGEALAIEFAAEFGLQALATDHVIDVVHATHV